MDPDQRLIALAHYEELARIGKALASPVRLRLIDLLRQGPRSVDVLASRSGVEVANVSQHLQQLRAAHIVVSEKQGQQVVYRLSNADVSAFFASLRDLGEALLPEFDRLREALRVLSEPERAALLKKIEAGRVALLDVRPEEEWRAGHLPGAIHIPLEELGDRLDLLSKRTPIVAYCRGPYCPMALSAVDVLTRAGFKAEHLDLGPAEVAERLGKQGAAKPRLRLAASATTAADTIHSTPRRRRKKS